MLPSAIWPENGDKSTGPRRSRRRYPYARQTGSWSLPCRRIRSHCRCGRSVRHQSPVHAAFFSTAAATRASCPVTLPDRYELPDERQDLLPFGLYRCMHAFFHNFLPGAQCRTSVLSTTFLRVPRKALWLVSSIKHKKRKNKYKEGNGLYEIYIYQKSGGQYIIKIYLEWRGIRT